MMAPSVRPDANAAGTTIRRDIQALRGVAVLAVLLYHAKVLPLAGGFLGVDIFFVISGFLITRNIVHELDEQRFSYINFYSRRAWRLQPAALCTFCVTSLLAATVLTEERWSDYFSQLVGAVTFTANFVLPLQTGYFEASAQTKPLLHTWSLSVEEQYYLLAPLLLAALRPNRRLAWMLAIAALSLTLCIFLVSSRLTYWRLPELNSQQLAFFMLPARAWEMLVGSALACAVTHRVALRPPRVVKLVALALLCLLFIRPLDSLHPRGDALLAVLLTALMLSGEGDWLGNSAPVRMLSRIGDWSYSLYLVHWPLFALASTAYLGQAPIEVRCALVGLSVLLAWLQYTHVEQRFRHAHGPPLRGVPWIAAASASTLVLSLGLGAARPHSDVDVQARVSPPNVGLSAGCAAAGALTDPAACSTSKQPRIAMWGDSYAMHLVPGLRKIERAGDGMLQITKAACAPILGVASIDANYDELWARGCLEFNRSAFELIASSESIQVVIMSSPFSGYLDVGELHVFDGESNRISDRTFALEQLVATIQGLQAHGKRPILVAPPPSPGFDIGACNQQTSEGRLVLGRSDCDFRLEDSQSRQRGIIDGLMAVRARTGVDVVWLDDTICAEGLCKTRTAESASIYRDAGHLSVAGSVWVVGKLGAERLIGNHATYAAARPPVNPQAAKTE